MDRFYTNYYLLNNNYSKIYFIIYRKISNGFRKLFFGLRLCRPLDVYWPCAEWAHYQKNSCCIHFLDKNRLYIYIDGSYGDIFPNLALMQHVYSKYKKQITILIPVKWRMLAERFNFTFTEYIFLENAGLFREKLMRSRYPKVLGDGSIFPLLPTLHPFLAEAILTDRITDYEVKRLLLNLPKYCEMVAPLLSSEREGYVKNFLKDLGCEPGNTLVLSFDRNSMPRVKMAVIKKVISYFLKNTSLYIAINSNNDILYQDLLGECAERIFVCELPADCAIEIISSAGYYMGVSHGLAAILATFPCTAAMVTLVDVSERLVPNNGVMVESRTQGSIIEALKYEVLKKNNYIEYQFCDEVTEDILDSALNFYLE